MSNPFQCASSQHEPHFVLCNLDPPQETQDHGYSKQNYNYANSKRSNSNISVSKYFEQSYPNRNSTRYCHE